MTTATARGPLTQDELLALPAAVDVETAGRAFGIGRTTAYALVRTDQFPCKVIRAGRTVRVVTEDMLRVLAITPGNGDGAGSSHPTPPAENSSHHQR